MTTPGGGENLGNAVLRLEADGSGLDQDLEKAKGNVDQTFRQMGERARALGTQLIFAGAAIGAPIAASVATVARFEQSMANVQAVSGATEKEFMALTDVAREMGRTTVFTANQSANALSFMSMAGLEAAESIEALPDVLNLAAAGQLGLAESADIVTNVMAGYGIAAEDVTKATDVLVKGFTSANTDLIQLGEAFKLGGPVAKAAGVQFEETAAALALMGNAGFQGSLAGTALRGAITRLLKPVGEGEDALERLGINVMDASGEMLPLVEIMEQFEDVGLTAADAMAIFGQRAGPGMLALLEQGSEALRDMTKEMESSGGTAQRIAETQLNTFSGQVTLLKSALEGLAISIGEQLLPTLREVVEWFTDAVGWVTRFADANPTLFKTVVVLGAVFAGLAVTLGGMLFVGGLLLSTVAGAIPIVVALASAVAGLGISFSVALGPIGLVTAALGFFIFKLMQSRDASDETRKATTEYEQVLLGLNETTRLSAETIEQMLARAFDEVATSVAAATDRLAGFRAEVEAMSIKELQDQSSDLKAEIEGIQQELANFEELQASLPSLDDSEIKTWEDLDAAMEAGNMTLAEYHAAVQALEAPAAIKALTADLERLEPKLQVVEAELSKNTIEVAMQRRIEILRELTAAYENGTLTFDEYNRGVAESADAMHVAGLEAEKIGSDLLAASGGVDEVGNEMAQLGQTLGYTSGEMAYMEDLGVDLSQSQREVKKSVEETSEALEEQADSLRRAEQGMDTLTRMQLQYSRGIEEARIRRGRAEEDAERRLTKRLADIEDDRILDRQKADEAFLKRQNEMLDKHNDDKVELYEKSREDLTDISEEYFDDRTNMEDEHHENLTDIQEDGALKEQELERRHAEALVELASEYDGDREDALEDHLEKLSDIRKRAALREADAALEQGRDREDVERNFQRKVEDLQRKISERFFDTPDVDIGNLVSQVGADTEVLEAYLEGMSDLTRDRDEALEDMNIDHARTLEDIEIDRHRSEEDAREAHQGRMTLLETEYNLNQVEAETAHLTRMKELTARTALALENAQVMQDARLLELKAQFDEDYLAHIDQYYLDLGVLEETHRVSQLDAEKLHKETLAGIDTSAQERETEAKENHQDALDTLDIQYNRDAEDRKRRHLQALGELEIGLFEDMTTEIRNAIDTARAALETSLAAFSFDLPMPGVNLPSTFGTPTDISEEIGEVAPGAPVKSVNNFYIDNVYGNDDLEDKLTEAGVQADRGGRVDIETHRFDR